MFSLSLRIKTKAVQGSQAHVARLGSRLGWHKTHRHRLSGLRWENRGRDGQ